MAIVIHEYLDGNGSINTNFIETSSNNRGSNIDINESANDINIDPESLMVDVEAIHALPYATRNHTRYTEKCLKQSINGWTKPYMRPLILHHNEKNGDIIGRVVDAKMKTKDTFSGTPALELTVNIPGDAAKTSVKNGLSQTVSIGVLAEDVRCSICGKQIELDESGNVVSCDHERGKVYNGEMAYWDIHMMEPKEVSYVVVPSDMFAKNVRNYPATKSRPTSIAASIDDTSGEPNKIGVQESLEKGESDTMDQKEFETKLKASEDKISKLEAQVSELISTKENISAQMKKVEEEKSGIEVKLKEAEQKIETLESLNKDLESKVSMLTSEQEELKQNAEQDVKMREGLEQELSDTKTALKESMIDHLQALRRAVGKSELDTEKLRNREESSIRDSIEDIKLELTESVSKIPEPNSVHSTVLTEEAKEESSIKTEKSDVDLEAGLQSIFMAVAGYHK